MRAPGACADPGAAFEAPAGTLSDTARQLGEVERAAGLPPGTVAEKFLGQLAAGWIAGDVGALQRWINSHFVFTGEPEEQAQIANALFRLESRWRMEAAMEESRGLEWS